MRLGQQQRRQLAELGRGCEAVHVGVEVHQRAHRQAEARRDPARRLVLPREVPSTAGRPRLLRLLLLLSHVLDLHLLGTRRAHRRQRPGALLEDGLHGVAQRERVRPLALTLRVIGSHVVVAAVATRSRGGRHRHLGLSALATDVAHHQLPSRAGSAHHDAPLGAVATLANGPNGKVCRLCRWRLAICSREWRRLRDGPRALSALLVRRRCCRAALRAGGLGAAVHERVTDDGGAARTRCAAGCLPLLGGHIDRSYSRGGNLIASVRTRGIYCM